MKTKKPVLLLLLLFMQFAAFTQVQWYQNQDANNPAPYGTVSTAVQSFNYSSFVACYLWSTDGDQNTWKISRSNVNGTEFKTYFITGIYALVEFKVGSNNSIYVFERSFTPEYMPQYKIYKLDASLNLKAQRNIELPNDFFIFNTNGFEIDESANVYVAGDGQYNDGSGNYLPASFVWKMDKNLNSKWRKVDSTETSYTRLHVDRTGKVLVISDYYAFFPQVRVKKFGPAGQYQGQFALNTSPNRYSLYSTLDRDNNLYIYGGKTVGDTAQAMYLYKIKSGNQLKYSKTLFTAASSQLNDLRFDKHGNMFSLVTQSFSNGVQLCKVSRINPGTGSIYWNRSIPYAEDSCNLVRLVMNGGDKLFAIGERKSCNYFSKGFAMRMKKYNGQLDGDFPAPDSVSFQRSHWLADGIMNNQDELIAIGNTSDLDTMTYSNTYFRAFAVRYNNSCGRGTDAKEDVPAAIVSAGRETPEEEDLTSFTKLMIYPNPVQSHLFVTGINTNEFDRLIIYSMQGAQLKQQYVRSETAKVDINGLADGAYLVVLRSSLTGRERSLKFVVKK